MDIPRLRAAPILIAALAMGAALFGAACDDDDAPPPDDRPRLTLEEYGPRIDGVQADAVRNEQAKIRELGEPEIRSSDGLNQTERDYLRALARLRASSIMEYVAGLDGLRPPAVVQGQHNAYANALEAKSEFLTERADAADDIDTAVELLEGQDEFDARIYQTCLALHEAVVGAGFPAFGLNCSPR